MCYSVTVTWVCCQRKVNNVTKEQDCALPAKVFFFSVFMRLQARITSSWKKKKKSFSVVYICFLLCTFVIRYLEETAFSKPVLISMCEEIEIKVWRILFSNALFLYYPVLKKSHKWQHSWTYKTPPIVTARQFLTTVSLIFCLGQCRQAVHVRLLDALEKELFIF